MNKILSAARAALLLALCLTSSLVFAAISEAEVQAARSTLKDSIAIPTVEGRGRVPEMAAYYADKLIKAGFAKEDIIITPLGETATLAATLHGKEATSPPILILGHMDVVEADPADWERDPFTAIEEGGYIFGRGSLDNKFDVAMVVTTLARLKREGYRPRQDVILLLSGDEETSMATTRVLAEQYQGAELALNSDGGGGVLGEDGKAQYYMMQAAEKTYMDFELEFTNPGGHSSRPSKTNAITQMANALSRLGAYDFEPQFSELTKASLLGMSGQADPEIGAALRRIVEHPDDAEALAMIRNNPEYVGQIGTTCVATMLDAGHATNALPQRATANINCRVFPGVTVEQMVAELNSVLADPAGKLKVKDEPSMSPASPLREDLMEAVTQAVYASQPDLTIFPGMSAYGTDSTHFRAAGIPSYGTSGLFLKPSDDFAHGLNERVPVSAIQPALNHWDVLIRAITK